MLVHRSRYDDALALAAKAAGGYKLGDPFAEGTRMGPLASATQRERVRGYIATGLAQGARLITGGLDAPVPNTGYFVAPTILADVDPDATVAQDEIFGPVLVIIPFDTDDQAVEIAKTPATASGGVYRLTPTAPSRSPAASVPAPSTSTAALRPRAPSVATSSPVSAANSANTPAGIHAGESDPTMTRVSARRHPRGRPAVSPR
jgi:hypothetical protein